MKYAILLLAAVIFISCESKRTDQLTSTDSLIQAFDEQKVKDSIMKKVKSDVISNMADTTGSWQSPIRVLSARLVDREYSSRRDLQLTFKNVSNKTVEGIKFQWTGVTAFGEPADMGNPVLEGMGTGYFDETLKPGKQRSGSYSIMSDAKKITSCVAYEVAFEDGSVWKLKE